MINYPASLGLALQHASVARDEEHLLDLGQQQLRKFGVSQQLTAVGPHALRAARVEFVDYCRNEVVPTYRSHPQGFKHLLCMFHFRGYDCGEDAQIISVCGLEYQQDADSEPGYWALCAPFHNSDLASAIDGACKAVASVGEDSWDAWAFYAMPLICAWIVQANLDNLADFTVLFGDPDGGSSLVLQAQ